MSQDSNAGVRESRPTRQLPRRQLLSCVQCRQRKIKCDRTEPCSACCARGRPKECKFVVTDGNDLGPIQQSYEIRQLRRENQRLRDRLREVDTNPSGDTSPDNAVHEHASGGNAGLRAVSSKQRRSALKKILGASSGRSRALIEVLRGPSNFPTYLGDVCHDHSRSSAHCLSYPFPMVRVGENTTAALTRLLPPKDEVLIAIDMFQSLCRAFPVPQLPHKMRRKEISRFFADLEANATRSPTMLALLFAAMAVVLQASIRNNGMVDQSSPQASLARSQCYIAASMQALRDASFMHEPSLLGVKALLVIGFYLSQSGRMQEAWVLFGTTIRIAYSINLHQDPTSLDPRPSENECMVRRGVWWLMLYTDLQLSLVCRKPLGIQTVGDSPPPEPWKTDPMESRLCGLTVEFVLVMRCIMSSDAANNRHKMREITKELMDLLDMVPDAMKFDDSWLHSNDCRPEWPLDITAANLYANIHSHVVTLNHQSPACLQSTENVGPARSFSQLHEQTRYIQSAQTSAQSSRSPSESILIDEHRLVVEASTHLLRTFLYLWHRNPAGLVYCTFIRQAANAALLLAREVRERCDASLLRLVEDARLVFVELLRSSMYGLLESVVGCLAGVLDVDMDMDDQSVGIGL